jgi:tRNA dimethylallyltransferase
MTLMSRSPDIDICSVRERMDVARYLTLARAAVEGIAARGRPVLVTGGSGFYLKAFLAPVADAVAVGADVRAQVQGLSAEAALAELRRLNPAGLGALDVANPRRVVRALERCRAAGRTLAELAAEFARQPAPFADWDVQVVRLERPPAELAARVEQRVTAMLAAGLVDEVTRLQAEGLEENSSAAGAIGYREVIALRAGRLAEAELAATIGRNTRALVKKQRTWFRTQLPPHRELPAASATVGDLFPT